MEIGFYEQVATADWATFQNSTLSLSSDYSLVLIHGRLTKRCLQFLVKGLQAIFIENLSLSGKNFNRLATLAYRESLRCCWEPIICEFIICELIIWCCIIALRGTSYVGSCICCCIICCLVVFLAVQFQPDRNQGHERNVGKLVLALERQRFFVGVKMLVESEEQGGLNPISGGLTLDENMCQSQRTTQ